MQLTSGAFDRILSDQTSAWQQDGVASDTGPLKNQRWMMRVAYRIDRQDCITTVGEDWQSFATANDAAAMVPQSVVGQRLLGFISDATVREIYAAVIAHVRRGKPVRFRYRCDAPAMRRDFEMEVVLLSNGEVEFRSTLLRESPRPPIALFRPAQSQAKVLVRMCSWCHAIADAEGRWHDLESAIVSMPVLDEQCSYGVTHGICPTCANAMLAALKGQPT